jgi:uncharacterized protein with HEPN domain
MPRDVDDAALLWDMLDAALAVSTFVDGRTMADFSTDRMLRGAIERHIEIIGQAAGKVSAAFRQEHPDIPWHAIIAQRNVLAHEYGDIKQELIWKVATVHVPALIRQLTPLVPPTPLGDTPA